MGSLVILELWDEMDIELGVVTKTLSVLRLSESLKA